MSEKLSPLQLNLLKLLAHNPSEEELRDLERLIVNYYAAKLQEEVDRVWLEKNYTEETVSLWLNEKLRRSSKLKSFWIRTYYFHLLAVVLRSIGFLKHFCGNAL